MHIMLQLEDRKRYQGIVNNIYNEEHNILGKSIVIHKESS